MWIVIMCSILASHYYLYSTLKVSRMDDSMGANISNKWGMGGGLLTLLYGWLTDVNTAVFIGTLVTVLGFIMSLYFQRRRHIREQRETEIRLELILKDEDRKHREELRKEELHLVRLEMLIKDPNCSFEDD